MVALIMMNIYYQIKPLIPRHMQLIIRRLIVALKIKKYSNIWPIDSSAGKKPVWFKEWPNGKKFVLLITHDVEHAAGLDQLAKLLAIDKKFNIRSSVGLVPERYRINPSVISGLKESGHELYVHDLNHDGKLFSSYETFHARAAQINHYLKKWNVRGFRAGAMHHNLDWISELDIDYDMSTFDTDPFEPMPEGMGTIFPFVASSTVTNRSYVEIPYTLPQDLLTLIIQPLQSIDTWIKKLDWVVENNGIACVNVHPDYIVYENEARSKYKYHYSLYNDFLAYITEHYSDVMWNTSASEIAEFVRSASIADRSL
jgi:hypothetical protein